MSFCRTHFCCYGNSEVNPYNIISDFIGSFYYADGYLLLLHLLGIRQYDVYIMVCQMDM